MLPSVDDINTFCSLSHWEQIRQQQNALLHISALVITSLYNVYVSCEFFSLEIAASVMTVCKTTLQKDDFYFYNFYTFEYRTFICNVTFFVISIKRFLQATKNDSHPTGLHIPWVDCIWGIVPVNQAVVETTVSIRFSLWAIELYQSSNHTASARLVWFDPWREGRKEGEQVMSAPAAS